MQNDQFARRFFYLILALICVGLAVFLRPYLMVITFAVLLAFLFNPLHRWLLRICGGREWFAVPLTFIGVLLAFVVPLGIAGSLIVQVVSDFVGAASSNVHMGTISLATFIEQLNRVLDTLPGIHYHLTEAGVITKLQEFESAVQSRAWEGIKGAGTTVAELIPIIFITVYVMGAMFVHYNRISGYLHKLSPLDDAIDHLYLHRIASMIISMVRGQFVIALVQGVLSGTTLAILGVPYAAFFGLLSVLLAIVPLGSSVIMLPVGLFMIMTGHPLEGVTALLVQLFIIGTIDNILRPKLIRKDASLHPALILIGVFAGLSQFGFLGIIYGPVFMIVAVTTFEVYLDYFAPKEPASARVS